MNNLPAARAVIVGILSVAFVFPSAARASSGTLDVSFGDNGVVSTAIGASATAGAVAVEPDGDLVTAGFAVIDGVHQLAVTRHHANGLLDRGFGVAGVVTRQVGIYPDSQAVLLGDDGTIVLAGKALADRTRPEMILARLHADGSLDRSFGNGGIVETETGTFTVNMVVGMARAPDGKLIVAANVGPNGVNNFGVLRFNADGSRDDTFGTDGMVVTEMPVFAAAASVAHCSQAIPGGLVLQPDGKVVVAGSVGLEDPGRSTTGVALGRYDADGSLDDTFGTGGIVITVLDSSTGAVLARLDDGRLLVGGTGVGGGGGFGLARYRPDGSLDTTFGSGGTVRTALPGYSAIPSGLLVEPDGKLVMNGLAYLGQNSRGVALARYQADGTPDRTFGTNGVTTTATGPLSAPTGPTSRHWTLVCSYRCVSPVVSQGHGRLIVADGARNSDDERPTFRLVRYADSRPPVNPDGPSVQSPTTSTTITGEPAGFPAANPPDDGLPTTGAQPTTIPIPAPSVTAVTTSADPSGPGSPRGLVPAGNSMTGDTTVPPTEASGPSPTTSESDPSPAERAERAAAATSGTGRGWSRAAGAAAVIGAGLTAIGIRRRVGGLGRTSPRK